MNEVAMNFLSQKSMNFFLKVIEQRNLEVLSSRAITSRGFCRAA